MNDEAAVSDYLQGFAGGADESIVTATRRARDAGVAPVAPDLGALLRWLTSVRGVRTAVEIGAAGGTSGLWVLQGMPAKGSLTSIEADPDARDAARRAYAAAGVTDRIRPILGTPAQVLPRLADDGYDLALLTSDVAGWPDHLPQIARLLRRDGLLVAVGALGDGAVADPGVDAPAVTALRTFNAAVGDDPRWQAVLLDYAGGLLLARLADGGEG